MEFSVDEVLLALASPPKLIDDLFDKQRDFFNDKAIYKAALCSRRAGKTWTAAEGLWHSALNSSPDSYTLYITLTRESAKRIIWPILRKQADKFAINAEFIESTLTVRVPEGGPILIYGADQDNLIERIRGLSINRAQIDEGQAFRSSLLEKLIDQVIDPALMDTGGDCWLLGTPGPIPAGFFYNLTQKDDSGWSMHKWTVWDNPHVPLAEERLAATMKRKGWSMNHPTIQREWFGRWVQDLDSLLYKFQSPKNVYKSLPEGHTWYSVIGIDYGYDDKTAVSTVKYSPKHPACFIERVVQKGQMTPSQIATFVKRQLDQAENVTNVVAAPGDLGKSITEEIRQRFGVNIEAADKRDKRTHIALMNGDFQANKLFVHESNIDYMEQLQTLKRADNGLEEPGMEDDLCDGSLYAYTKAVHYAYRQEPPPIDIRSNEYAKLMEEIEVQKLEEALEEEKLEQDSLGLFDGGEDYDQYI